MSDEQHEHGGGGVPPWVIYVGVGLALACITLGVLWWVQHPGKSPLAPLDLDPVAQDGPTTNGHHPVPASVSGEGSVEGSLND